MTVDFPPASIVTIGPDRRFVDARYEPRHILPDLRGLPLSEATSPQVIRESACKLAEADGGDRRPVSAEGVTSLKLPSAFPTTAYSTIPTL